MDSELKDGEPHPETPLETPKEEKEELVETVINGETFMVKPEMAEALKKQTPDPSDLELKISSLNEKIESLKPEEKPEYDVDAFFEDPFKYLNEFRNQVKEDVSKELRQEYIQDKSAESFWKEFYTDNDDLKGAETLVEAVLNKNSAKLGDMSVSKASKELAELTRKEILKLMPKETQKTPIVEGGKEISPPEVAKEEKVVTLGDIVRDRRNNRRKAAKGG